MLRIAGVQFAGHVDKAVDGAPFFANHEARLQKQAKAQGITLKRISYADAGFDMYSLVIFAREDTIAKTPSRSAASSGPA